MGGILLISGIALAGVAQLASPEKPVYVAKPWGEPVMQRPTPIIQSRSVTSRTVSDSAAQDAPVPDTHDWLDASQSIMRKFVCEARPAGLVYDKSVCGKSAVR